MPTSSKKTSKALPDQPSIQGISLDFESWIAMLKKETLSVEDQALWLKGLQENPEWINQENADQLIPLIRASHYGQVEAVKALIQKGSDVHVQNKDG